VRRARILALVAVPVILLGSAGCRSDDSAPRTPGGSGDGEQVEQQFDDIESTLDSIESELAGD